MTPWGFVMVAIVGLVTPFFIAPLIDRTHPSFTSLGLAMGFVLSLAFGAWRLTDTLSRLDSVEASSHGFLFQAFLVAVGALTAATIAGLLLILGIVIGGLLGRRSNRPAS
jgi:hypothetical protein